MFFTRIPIPFRIPYSQKILQQSARYFSWVGLLVGIIAVGAFAVFSVLFSTQIAIAGSMLVSILTTGAFHEDGFADCCDAFGGGYTKEKILTIMKDSRLGTYGVVGVIGILAFKFLLLQELYNTTSIRYFIIVIVTAHSISRFMAVCIMQILPYVQDIDSSKIKPLANQPLKWYELAIGIFAALTPFYFLPLSFLLSILVTLVVMLLCSSYFKKQINGYTGDCLGATQQLTELSVYCSCILIIKFIE